jgi:purine-nucleoside phosphorylase
LRIETTIHRQGIQDAVFSCNLPGMSDMLTPERLRRAADDFCERYQPGLVLALLVAGSGLRLEVPGWDAGEEIPLEEIFPFPLHSLMGHRQTMTLWRRGGESLMVANGRFHLYQGYRPEEVVAPVRLAGLLGAETMIATNATGSLDPQIGAGSMVVIRDHLNLQGVNPLVGDWGREFGPQFPDMSEAYDPLLREVAQGAAREAGFEVREGVYAAVLGPSFETPAEVKMLRAMGGSVVGMSTVPEVLAARHMGMKVLVLSLAANPAAGLVDRPLTHSEVLEVGEHAAEKLAKLIGLLVDKVFV